MYTAKCFSYACVLSHVPLSATPWTAARQTPLFIGFSKQENWGGLPFPPPGDLLNPGIKSMSPAPLALAGVFFTNVPFRKPVSVVNTYLFFSDSFPL